MVTIKTEKEIALIRESSRLVADVLRLLEKQIYPGIATKMLDDLAEDFIRSSGGIPAFKGYGNDRRNLFPASLCVSIDDEVVHGIPGTRVLKEGEIVSLDVGVVKDGFYGDGASTFPVGRVSEGKARLMRVTKESLDKGVEQAIDGNFLHDISHAVQRHVEGGRVYGREGSRRARHRERAARRPAGPELRKTENRIAVERRDGACRSNRW